MDHLNHAKHNESVCKHLYKKETYSDWVITTAFYSAIHYIRHLIIPIRIEETLYNNFETLFAACKGWTEGRHGFQLRHVLENHPDIEPSYRILWDMSNNARYINYIYNRDQANVAKDALEEVKQYILDRR